MILFLVSLFAGLGYAVSHSLRNNSASPEKEKYSVYASRLTQYPISVRTAVLRINTVGRATPEEISFDYPAWGDSKYQHAVPSPDTFKVFYPDGGGVPWQKPDLKYLDSNFSSAYGYGKWLFTGSSCIPNIGSGSDADCNASDTQLELIAVLPYIERGLCIQINKKLGVNAANNYMPPQDVGDAWSATPEFDGTFGPGEVILDAGTILKGLDAACFEGGGTPPAGSYHFYSTLMQR